MFIQCYQSNLLGHVNQICSVLVTLLSNYTMIIQQISEIKKDQSLTLWNILWSMKVKLWPVFWRKTQLIYKLGFSFKIWTVPLILQFNICAFRKSQNVRRLQKCSVASRLRYIVRNTQYTYNSTLGPSLTRFITRLCLNFGCESIHLTAS